jgi:hypothetical protein
MAGAAFNFDLGQFDRLIQLIADFLHDQVRRQVGKGFDGLVQNLLFNRQVWLRYFDV